jgi:hypothetical protein
MSHVIDLPLLFRDVGNGVGLTPPDHKLGTDEIALGGGKALGHSGTTFINSV